MVGCFYDELYVQALPCAKPPLSIFSELQYSENRPKSKFVKLLFRHGGPAPQHLSFYSPHFFPFKIKFRIKLRLLSINSKLGPPSVKKNLEEKKNL
jgi:hypothetical protein